MTFQCPLLKLVSTEVKAHNPVVVRLQGSLSRGFREYMAKPMR